MQLSKCKITFFFNICYGCLIIFFCSYGDFCVGTLEGLGTGEKNGRLMTRICADSLSLSLKKFRAKGQCCIMKFYERIQNKFAKIKVIIFDHFKVYHLA